MYSVVIACQIDMDNFIRFLRVVIIKVRDECCNAGQFSQDLSSSALCPWGKYTCYSRRRREQIRSTSVNQDDTSLCH